MSNLQPATPQITIQENDSLTTTSTAVAEFFGREHRNVTQKVEALDCSEHFRSANFSALVKTVAMPKGRGTKEITYYQMTEQGFTFLAMGFTGKKAAAFKEAYIIRFHAMQTELLKKYKQAALPQIITPKQKLAIREAIAEKVYAHYPEGKRQLGFSMEYKAFYKAFDISTYSELPENRYGDAILFILGDYEPPAEALTVDDDHIAFSKCNHDAATQLIALLQAQHEAFAAMQAKVNGLAEEFGTVTKELQAFKTSTHDIVKDLSFALH